MTALPPNPRYEHKFLAPGFSLAEVVAIVRRHPALFREIYPPRAVNNIYLDSAHFQDYTDHVRGVADRVKTRLRWYGQLQGPIARPNLERKLKHGLLGGKLTHPLPCLALNGHIDGSLLHATLARAEMPDLLRLALHHLRPALVNRYQRRYWLSACGRFRLTLDWDLQFFGLRTAPLAAVGSSPRIPAVIIELKVEPQHAEDLAAVTNALPFRLVRCSKYVLGIERLHSS